jgi:hypothetical protein
MESFDKKPISRVLKKTLLAGCSKTLRYKAPEIPRRGSRRSVPSGGALYPIDY